MKENDYWKRSCGLTLMDKIRNEEIQNRAEVDINITEIVEAKRLKLDDHVMRSSKIQEGKE